MNLPDRALAVLERFACAEPDSTSYHRACDALGELAQWERDALFDGGYLETERGIGGSQLAVITEFGMQAAERLAR